VHLVGTSILEDNFAVWYQLFNRKVLCYYVPILTGRSAISEMYKLLVCYYIMIFRTHHPYYTWSCQIMNIFLCNKGKIPQNPYSYSSVYTKYVDRRQMKVHGRHRRKAPLIYGHGAGQLNLLQWCTPCTYGDQMQPKWKLFMYDSHKKLKLVLCQQCGGTPSPNVWHFVSCVTIRTWFDTIHAHHTLLFSSLFPVNVANSEVWTIDTGCFFWTVNT